MSDEQKKLRAGTFGPAIPEADQKAKLPINGSDEKLLEFLKNAEKSLEPVGPLAGPAQNGWFDEEE